LSPPGGAALIPPRSVARRQHRQQLTRRRHPRVAQRTMAITPRPPSRPPGPALCESAGGGAGSDLRGGRSGVRRSPWPEGQISKWHVRCCPWKLKRDVGGDQQTADKCPAAAVIAAIRASGGVLRRRPDGKGAGVGWRAVGSVARVARTDDAGAQQTADYGLMIRGPLARDPDRLTR